MTRQNARAMAILRRKTIVACYRILCREMGIPPNSQELLQAVNRRISYDCLMTEVRALGLALSFGEMSRTERIRAYLDEMQPAFVEEHGRMPKTMEFVAAWNEAHPEEPLTGSKIRGALREDPRWELLDHAGTRHRRER